jgi:hypothetical protein
MNFKTTYALFAVLVALLGVLAFVLITGPVALPNAENLFPSMLAKDSPLDAKAVEKIVIKRLTPEKDEIVFERVDEKNWKITKPRELAADSSRVTQIFEALKDAKFSPKDAPTSASRAGFDEPTREILISAGDRQFSLTVGLITPGEESAIAYVRSSERGSTPLAVKKRSIESALESLAYYRNKDLLAENTADLREIKLSQGKKPPIELAKDNERWRLVNPSYGDVDATDLLARLGDLKVSHRNDKDSDFVKDQVTSLADYHLDASKADVLRIEVSKGEGAKKSKAVLLVGTSKKEGEKYFATLDEGGKTNDIVKVPATAVEPILKIVDDPSAMRSKALLALEAFKQPDAITIKNAFGELEFYHSDAGKPWELYRGQTGYPVDEQVVRKLIDELNRKDAILSFAEASKKKELGLEGDVVVVKVYADSLELPKKDDKDKKDAPSDTKMAKPVFKKDAKPVAELRFGPRELKSVERIWGNDVAIGLVSEYLIDEVRKSPLAYFEKRIAQFNPFAPEDDVTKVEIHRGSEKFEMARETTKAPWLFSAPAALKGRKVGERFLSDILGDLNRPSVREIVSEKADARDLAAWELSPPQARVIITQTKDKKTTVHDYLIGKEDPTKGLYLKLGTKDMVYRVDPILMINLKKEPRDTTVFNFAPEQVIKVTAKGWASVTGAPLTYVLEQKDGAWKATTPADFPLDGQKAADLVNALSRLQAEKFVPAGKAMTLNEDALELEITMADKTVYQLTLGGLDANSYFATSSTLKGEVFTVSKTPFEEGRKKPAWFRK